MKKSLIAKFIIAIVFIIIILWGISKTCAADEKPIKYLTYDDSSNNISHYTNVTIVDE